MSLTGTEDYDEHRAPEYDNLIVGVVAHRVSAADPP